MSPPFSKSGFCMLFERHIPKKSTLHNCTQHKKNKWPGTRVHIQGCAQTWPHQDHLSSKSGKRSASHRVQKQAPYVCTHHKQNRWPHVPSFSKLRLCSASHTLQKQAPHIFAPNTRRINGLVKGSIQGCVRTWTHQDHVPSFLQVRVGVPITDSKSMHLIFAPTTRRISGLVKGSMQSCVQTWAHQDHVPSPSQASACCFSATFQKQGPNIFAATTRRINALVKGSMQSCADMGPPGSCSQLPYICTHHKKNKCPATWPWIIAISSDTWFVHVIYNEYISQHGPALQDHLVQLWPSLLKHPAVVPGATSSCGILSLMAPKKWNNRNTLTNGQLRELVIKDGKHIERLGWKQQDPEECASYMPQFLVGLASCTIRFSKTQLLQVLQKTKLTLSQSEMRLFAEKVSTCWSHIKTKWRDCGSGKFMSPQAKKVRKTWERSFGKAEKMGKLKHAKATKKKDED